jgi:hypothetical protein
MNILKIHETIANCTDKDLLNLHGVLHIEMNKRGMSLRKLRKNELPKEEGSEMDKPITYKSIEEL